jgi:precorrin-4 methylase
LHRVQHVAIMGRVGQVRCGGFRALYGAFKHRGVCMRMARVAAALVLGVAAAAAAAAAL